MTKSADDKQSQAAFLPVRTFVNKWWLCPTLLYILLSLICIGVNIWAWSKHLDVKDLWRGEYTANIWLYQAIYPLTGIYIAIWIAADRSFFLKGSVVLTIMTFAMGISLSVSNVWNIAFVLNIEKTQTLPQQKRDYLKNLITANYFDLFCNIAALFVSVVTIICFVHKFATRNKDNACKFLTCASFLLTLVVTVLLMYAFAKIYISSKFIWNANTFMEKIFWQLCLIMISLFLVLFACYKAEKLSYPLISLCVIAMYKICDNLSTECPKPKTSPSCLNFWPSLGSKVKASSSKQPRIIAAAFSLIGVFQLISVIVVWAFLHSQTGNPLRRHRSNRVHGQLFSSGWQKLLCLIFALLYAACACAHIAATILAWESSLRWLSLLQVPLVLNCALCLLALPKSRLSSLFSAASILYNIKLIQTSLPIIFQKRVYDAFYLSQSEGASTSDLIHCYVILFCTIIPLCHLSVSLSYIFIPNANEGVGHSIPVRFKIWNRVLFCLGLLLICVSIGYIAAENSISIMYWYNRNRHDLAGFSMGKMEKDVLVAFSKLTLMPFLIGVIQTIVSCTKYGCGKPATRLLLIILHVALIIYAAENLDNYCSIEVLAQGVYVVVKVTIVLIILISLITVSIAGNQVPVNRRNANSVDQQNFVSQPVTALQNSHDYRCFDTD